MLKEMKKSFIECFVVENGEITKADVERALRLVNQMERYCVSMPVSKQDIREVAQVCEFMQEVLKAK